MSTMRETDLGRGPLRSELKFCQALSTTLRTKMKSPEVEKFIFNTLTVSIMQEIDSLSSKLLREVGEGA